MKSKMTQFFMIVMIMISSLAVKADAEKTKTISKNYKVSKTTELAIRNSFGKVHINNWDKSEFDIKVEVIVEASNDNKAQEMLDRIEIEIDESSSAISFETQLNKMKTKNNERFEINYTISMPKDNPLFLKNSFGDAYVDTRAGEAKIEIAYGSLKARDFMEEADIKVSFGSGDIGIMKEGDLEIKYSSAEIQELQLVELNEGFSEVEIETAGKLDLVSKYGSVEIGQAAEIEADVQFSKFEIDELSGYIDMEASYVSGFEIKKVSKDFQFLYLDSKFSSAEIYFEPGVSADFEGEFEFCDLKVSGLEMDYSVRIKEDNGSEYKAKMGSGPTDNRRVRVYSSYGNVRISER